jgi:prepilin-type N-terminal cleavage/methylation domain-containing protein
MSQQNKKNLRGFTFIELMVVIAIIGIMAAISLVPMINSRNQKMVDAEGRKVAAAVREMQNDALAGKGATGCNYTFTYTNASNSYKLGGCVTVNYTLASGVTFSNATNTSFSISASMAPWGTLTLVNPPAPPWPVAITLKKGTATNYVCVYSSGNVVENGANSTCP